MFTFIILVFWLTVEETVIRVRLPKWIVDEAHRRGLKEDDLARAALKLTLLEEIISQHGLDEEDLEWILGKRKSKKH